MAADAIISLFTSIDLALVGLGVSGSGLLSPLGTFMPVLYGYVMQVMQQVALPVASVVLALFFVLEIYRASLRTENMGSHSTKLGAEIVVRILVRLVIFKTILDNVPKVLEVIYSTCLEITKGISSLALAATSPGSLFDLSLLQTEVEALSIWSQIGLLVTCLLVFFIAFIVMNLAQVMVIGRFIELFIYIAIAPIPLATLPSDELGHIGKGFLKSFTAVCLHGCLIYLVLTFYPVILASNIFSASGDWVHIALGKAVGYSLILAVTLFQTNRLAKSLCQAV